MHTPPFINDEALDMLKSHGREVSFPPGTYIVRRGDPGSTFYAITSGVVDIRSEVRNHDKPSGTFLEKGNFFGASTLLTSAPALADVVSTSPVTVIACEKDSFFDALEKSAPLRKSVSIGLAAHVQRADRDVRRLHRRTRALNGLLGQKPRSEALIARSSAMRQVKTTIENLCHRSPVAIMVHGKPGTGKTYVASVLHLSRFGENAPFFAIDCRSLCCEDARTLLFGSLRPETAPNASGEEELGLPMGALELAGEGTLVLRNIDSLDMISQEGLVNYLRGLPSTHGGPSRQLVFTSRKTPSELDREGLLHPHLADMCQESSIYMPKLSERRRDILPLAALYLEKCEGQGRFSFTDSANHALVTSGYSTRHAAELREVVRLATQVTESLEIDSEHLLFGAREPAGPRELDLQRSPFWRHALSPGMLRFFRGVLLGAFLAIVMTTLFAPRSLVGKYSNILIWGIWEPILFASFFFLGRAWCTLCPVSSMGKYLAGWTKPDSLPPDWIKKNSGHILIFGFLAIFSTEHFFAMAENPFPSGLLLATILAVAVYFALLYTRESWCRHLCPLGGLGAAYATPAVLNVKANAHICSTQCTTHECYRGSEKHTGCPTFRHPLDGSDSHFCKMCLTCIANCPHGGSRLLLRTPLRTVWHSEDLGDSFLPFAFFLFFYGPALLASKGGAWTGTRTGFAVTSLLAVVLAYAFGRIVPGMLSRTFEMDRIIKSRIALCLLVLAWGPLMAYQLYHVPGISSLVLHTRAGTGVDGLVHPGEVSILLALQLMTIAAAAGFSMLAFWRVRLGLSLSGSAKSIGWKVLALICCVYILTNALTVLARGILF